MNRTKYRIMLLMIPILLISGCDRNLAENREEQEKITISILAGQSTSDAGTEDMIEEALKEYFPQVELQWECVDWGEDFYDRLSEKPRMWMFMQMPVFYRP